MLTALTGTPGTGKSTVGAVLRRRGLKVSFLKELAESCGALRGYDHQRRTWEVDLDLLAKSIPGARPLILVGHMAHHMPVDMAIVLRCHPEVLRRRLESRGWNSDKISENVEAEAIGVITAEAMGRVETFEINTTDTSPEETARAVMEILAGRGELYRAGWVDWSEVILDWY